MPYDSSSGIAGQVGPQRPEKAARFYHLDSLRAFALLLGVLWHAAESFGPRNSYWAVVDVSTSEFLEWFRFGCHSFRMEIFFLLAGFFARLLLHRRGVRGFLSNRVRRIVAPLVAGWLLLYPLVVLIWMWGWSRSGRLGDFGVPLHLLKSSLWSTWWALCSASAVLHKFGLIHLWFLYQLLALYFITLGLRWLTGKIHRSARLLESLDRWFAKACSSPIALIYFSAVGIPLMLLMRNWTVDTPNESLVPELPATLLFEFCFLLGWLFHRQPTLLDRFCRSGWLHLEIAFVLWAWFGLYGKYDYQELNAVAQSMPRREFVEARIIHMSIYSCMMWAFILSLLGLFTRYFARPSQASRYVVDASYWVYLIHFPVVVLLQVMIGPVHAPWLVKYLFVNGITLSILFVSYHCWVRNTVVGLCLNGQSVRELPRA